MFGRGGRGHPPPQGFFPDFFDIFMGGGGYFPGGAGFEDFFATAAQQQQQQQSEDYHPPASRRFINTLPEIVITKEDLDVETTNGECAICLSDQKLGQTATRMPCGHLFCNECLKGWLIKSNTCPVCRYEVETDDPEYESKRMQKMANRKMRFRHRELEVKSVSELKQLMRILRISTEGCIEKSDMIKRLEESSKIEMVRTTTAQQVYTLTELLAMNVETLKRLMQGFGVRVRQSDAAIEKIDLIRALANSGRIIVSTEGASPEDVAELQRQLSFAVPRDTAPLAPTGYMDVANEEDANEEREPKLQRTHAAVIPPAASAGASSATSSTPGGGRVPYSRLELEGMRIGQLKELLNARHIPLDGLLEKKDLIDRLLE